jgi:hypothetical protein
MRNGQTFFRVVDEVTAESGSGEIAAVFVQAPGDLRYAFTIYEAAVQRGATILLIVVNVRSVYEYLLDIQLPDLELHFVPYFLQPMPRLPWTLFRIWRQLASRYASIFADRKVSEAWFFCLEWDAVTPYFLKRLSKRASIFLVDHYGVTEPREKRWPLKLAVKWLLLRMVTGVSFGFCRETREAGAERVWRTAVDAAALGAKATALTPSVARFPLPTVIRPPAVILMDSNDEASPDMSGYPETVSALLADLKARNVSVLLKAHPRSGHSPFLNQFGLPALPEGCPLELFDIRNVSAVIGTNSLGLATVANLGHRAVSLLCLVGFYNEETRRFWREYLDRQSGRRVLFPQSTGEALEMIDGGLQGLQCTDPPVPQPIC